MQNGRPYNYIKNETQLKEEFEAYYEKVNAQIQQNKKEQQAKLQQQQLEKQEVVAQLLQSVSKQVSKEVNDGQLNLKSSLRQFLMQNIVPTLSDGLLEVAKVQPEDPVEFLAEYLFEKSFDL